MNLKNSQKVSLTGIFVSSFGRSERMKCNIDIQSDAESVSCKSFYEAKVVDLKKNGKGSVDHKKEIAECGMHSLTLIALGLTQKRHGDFRKSLYVLLVLTKQGKPLRNGQIYIRCPSRFVWPMHEDISQDDTIGEATMYERRGDPMCPVILFQKYLTELHPNRNSLWQRPLDTFHHDDASWYCKWSVLHVHQSLPSGNFDNCSRPYGDISSPKSESSNRSHTKRLTETKVREMSDTLGNEPCPANSTDLSNQAVSTELSNQAFELSDQEILSEFNDENEFDAQ
ncbi:LOW QUALITY PROTEIN: hypothetical protein MAR_013544 [Mya arenaria]|uniref:Uncharacterized protein n=1 Tax=Mya arenaria TaxID=6604 RepID=A0ABY7G0T3_MYAAR|nr:LOW QUALITY PROTEIN: hypothetical protein MAR_013544 [Mya arenaria]